MHLSVGMLVASIFVGLIGAALVLYGRKETRVPHMVAGAILIVFPYFAHWWWMVIAITVVVLAALAIVSKLGY